LQLGRFAVKICAHEEEKLDDESEIENESTYEEDAPYLPKTLLDFVEKDSVRLGLKNEPLRFDDLEKVRIKELRIENREEDTSSALNPPPDTNMMFHTMRDTNMNTNQNLALMEATHIQRRNSDLVENTLDEIGNNLRSMELSDDDNDDLRAPRHAAMMTTGNHSEQEHNTTGRMQLQTELGIHAPNNMATSTSPIGYNANDQGETSISRSREGSSSRMSMNEVDKLVSHF
jgi:hypothetical protein